MHGQAAYAATPRPGIPRLGCRAPGLHWYRNSQLPTAKGSRRAPRRLTSTIGPRQLKRTYMPASVETAWRKCTNPWRLVLGEQLIFAHVFGRMRPTAQTMQSVSWETDTATVGGECGTRGTDPALLLRPGAPDRCSALIRCEAPGQRGFQRTSIQLLWLGDTVWVQAWTNELSVFLPGFQLTSHTIGEHQRPRQGPGAVIRG